jgi:hypothetical protein
LPDFKQGDLVVFAGKWSKTQSSHQKIYYGQLGLVLSKSACDNQRPWTLVDIWFVSHPEKKFFIEKCYNGDLELIES